MEAEREEFNQNNGNSLVGNHIYPSILNASTSNSLSEVTLAHPIIKSWLYWLGADLVSQWRTLPIENWSFATVFHEINPQLSSASSLLLTALAQSKVTNDSILDLLELKYQSIYQQQARYFTTTRILKWVIPLAATLANALTKSTQKCLEQLEINVDDLRTKLHQKQHIYFLVLSSAGTKSAFACLDSLSEQLHSLTQEYERQWQKSLFKSSASRHSFENLSAQISQWWELSRQQKADSALNSLRLTYKYQLEGQLYNAACQLLKELETQTQQHILYVTEVDLWLAQLQSWFVQQYPLDPVPTDFLKHYLSPRINAVEFLKAIEEWADCTTYNWVRLDEDELSDLKAEILRRLQPICWEFYTECFQINKRLSSNDITHLQK